MIGKNENVKLWESNIFTAIKDIGDIELQEISWLGKDPTIVSSYWEMRMMLYDNLDFKRFLEYFKTKNFDSLYLLLLELNDLLLNYKRLETDEQVLKDPNWIAITKKATEIYNQYLHTNDIDC